MTIIVKEGMEDWMIFKKKPNSIDSLVQYVESFAERYSHDTIRRVGKNFLKRATLCLEAEVAIFSIFCRTPIVVPLSF